MAVSASRLWFDNEKMFVELTDMRIIGVPLSWFPKLKSATTYELSKFEFWNDGKWIHWETLDEDLSVEGFLKTEVSHPTSTTY